MNIYGHQQALKGLLNAERFWESCAKSAEGKKLHTASNVCGRILEGEKAKMKWHRKQINFLRGGRR